MRATAVAAAKAAPRPTSNRLQGFSGPSVFSHFTPLAVQHDAVNLGQGFPGWAAPSFVKQCMVDAVQDNHNQYCRSGGHPDLVTELAAQYTESLGAPVDALANVAVMNGATQGLYAGIHALVEPGEEVVLLNPFYDSYAANVSLAGAVAKHVPIRCTEDPAVVSANDAFTLSLQELDAAITPKTRLLILNTPHNPTGKVFTRDELAAIADVVLAHPHMLVLADEVYDRITYDTPHVSIASLPGMFDRTVTVSSFGKTFSCTGFKLGWCVGPADLIARVMSLVQWETFCTSTPMQVGAAAALRMAAKPYKGADDYYEWLRTGYRGHRDVLVDTLKSNGLRPIVPEGSFFVLGCTDGVDWPRGGPGADGDATTDWRFCEWLCATAGVAAIPPSSFYAPHLQSLAAPFARFAFCKPLEDLREAGKRLEVLTGV